MPENALDIGNLSIEMVFTRPQTNLFPFDIWVVEYAMRPAVGLDGSPPQVGIFIVRVSHALAMPGLSHSFCAAAQDANVAGHGLKRCSHAVVLFAIAGTAWCPRSLQGCRLGLGIHVSQLADVVGLDTTDLLCPFRGFWRVVVLAKDIVLEILLPCIFLG
ncbi:hypothetical protein D3C72_1588630 [compost metagenome]